MRPNLITQLKEEWNNLDPVDPLRGLIADAIDALAEAQPSKPLTEKIKNEFWIKAIQHGKNGQSMNWQAAADFYANAIEAAHGIKGDA